MEIIILVLAFAVTITIHEMAHAWAADRLGDPTARLAGRLSINPMVHYDPVGTTLLIVTVFLTSLGIAPFPFGWAKPVPIDPYNLRHPRKDAATISLAGPLTNLIFASILAFVVRVSGNSLIFSLFYPVILLNVALAVFNLIPIHPLDGGKVIVGILGGRDAKALDAFLSRYGTLLLFFLIFPVFGGTSLVSIIVIPIVNLLIGFLLPGAGLI
ncbi:MAG TPA: site-2 protease family protein [Patescibacteria group bacterium]|nr:site-2 protease family protein [Patescibacteria group bacterium]